MAPYMADVLDAGIPFLVYNGDRDMTTNMVGQEKVLNSMEWSGQKDWLDAPRGLWMTDKYESGWAKEYKGLSFVVVYNSGVSPGSTVAFTLSISTLSLSFLAR